MSSLYPKRLLPLIIGSAIVGGWVGRDFAIIKWRSKWSDFKKQDNPNIPTNILIAPTILGACTGAALYPLTTVLSSLAFLAWIDEEYNQWAENELKKANSG